jgi:hypothetical protein
MALGIPWNAEYLSWIFHFYSFRSKRSFDQAPTLSLKCSSLALTPDTASASISSRHQESRASHETSSPHPCHSLISLSIVPQTPMHIPSGSYLAITSEHHSYQSFHNGPPFLLTISPFILPVPFWVHCLVPRTIPHYLSLSVTISSYTASILVTPPYAHSFPFLPFYFPSHSHWLNHLIFVLALTHLSSHWLDYSSSIVPSIPLLPTGR